MRCFDDIVDLDPNSPSNYPIDETPAFKKHSFSSNLHIVRRNQCQSSPLSMAMVWILAFYGQL